MQIAYTWLKNRCGRVTRNTTTNSVVAVFEFHDQAEDEGRQKTNVNSTNSVLGKASSRP